MNYHTKEELMEALRVVSSSIINCEKYNQNLQRDFPAFTS